MRKMPKSPGRQPFQHDRQLPDRVFPQSVGFVDDHRTAAPDQRFGSHRSFDVFQSRRCAVRCVDFLRGEFVRRFRGNQPGNRRLARSRLSGDPERAAADATFPQDVNPAQRSRLSNDIRPTSEPIPATNFANTSVWNCPRRRPDQRSNRPDEAGNEQTGKKPTTKRKRAKKRAE